MGSWTTGGVLAVDDVGVDEGCVVFDVVVAADVAEAGALAALAEEVEAAVRREEPGEGEVVAGAEGVDEDGGGDALTVAWEVAVVGARVLRPGQGERRFTQFNFMSHGIMA